MIINYLMDYSDYSAMLQKLLTVFIGLVDIEVIDKQKELLLLFIKGVVD